MELALSLGGNNNENNNNPNLKPFSLFEKNNKRSKSLVSDGLGFCMKTKSDGLNRPSQDHKENKNTSSGSDEPGLSPVQLDLLPLSPVHRRRQPPSQLRFPWLSENCATEETEDATSPNSAASSYKMDFSIFRNGILGKRDYSNCDGDRDQRGNNSSNSRASDDDENGSGRKKLRLSKEQSAFLEESFKEHNTLNPKQKLALAKQLNLRPRQVEVWFQNRRARTKLKQTEVDCEYLKRCCETLTEENRRLQKELQELRALKASQPFYMQLPATTLTMCPSCERVASNTTTTATTTTTTATASPGSGGGGGGGRTAKPKLFQFPSPPPQTAS